MGCPRACAALAAVGFVLLATDARAQTTAEDGPKVQEIRSVERGFFIESDIGFTFFVNKMDDRRYSLAPILGLFAGYDILPILNISLGANAIAAGLSVDENTPAPRGDLFFLIPSARLQFAVLTTERNFVWIRGEVGFGIALPGDIDGVDYGGNGLALGGAIGFERFTKLRHFSVGGVVGVNVVTKPAVGIGISIIPMVKYTF